MNPPSSTPSTTTRTPSSNPTTLLWAHQIRRENIHLHNQLTTLTRTSEIFKQALSDLWGVVQELQDGNDALRADFDALRKTVEVVSLSSANRDDRTHASKTANAKREKEKEKKEKERAEEQRKLFHDLEERVDNLAEQILRVCGKIDGFSEREGNLETEMGKRVYERVRGDVVREVLGVLKREVVEGVSLGRRVGDDNQAKRRRTRNSTRITNEESDSYVVPDSMPLSMHTAPSTGAGQNQNQEKYNGSNLSNQRTGPRTATASLRNAYGSSDRVLRGNRQRHNPASASSTEGNQECNDQILGKPNGSGVDALKQDGRSLEEYLDFALEVRRRHPQRRREGGIVEAFIDGLDEQGFRVGLEEELDREGWRWGVLESMLKLLIEQQRQPGEAVGDRVGVTGSRHEEHGEVPEEQGKTSGAVMTKQKEKGKKRRHIPIVPVDEEDLLMI